MGFEMTDYLIMNYLSNQQQYVFINGYESGLTKINSGVPQGSVLGTLFFLLYINGLNQAIKFCKVHPTCKYWPKKPF